jgi:two-component system sensor histidine kinase RegB
MPSSTGGALPNRIAPAALINLHWIVRLRWLAVAGQLATIVIGAQMVTSPLPLRWLLVVCAALGLFNAGVQLWMRRGGSPTDRTSGLNLLVDIGALTALLAGAGGVSNPFSILYLVHITIAAVVLPSRWTQLLAVASALAYSALALGHGRLPELVIAGQDKPGAHAWASWVAFVVGVAFVSTFSYRMSRALRRREAELQKSRADAEASERLVALGTLAAGTAHELNTPLGTIAILAAELSDQLDGDRRAEAEEIRKQVRRCKGIITSMLAPPGNHAEDPEDVKVAATVEAAVRRWREGRPGPAPEVFVEPGVANAEARLPKEAFVRALENLLDNAYEATAGRAERSVRIELGAGNDGELKLAVVDNGVGVPEELQNRIGEPFFTTKGPGAGSGLGLYLARHVVERQGGSMQVVSREGQGTRIVLTMLES